MVVGTGRSATAAVFAGSIFFFPPAITKPRNLASRIPSWHFDRRSFKPAACSFVSSASSNRSWSAAEE